MVVRKQRSNMKLSTPQTQNYRIFDFSGGLNSKYSSHTLQDNESSDIVNVVFSEKGFIKKRPGIVIFNDYPKNEGQEVVTLMKYLRREGIRYIFSVFADKTVQYNTTKDGAIENKNLLFKDKDGKVITIQKTHFSFFTFNNIFYMGNNVDGWFKWDASDEYAKAVSGIPKCDYAALKNARAYYTGDATQKDRIHFSKQGNVEDTTMIVGENEVPENGGGIIDIPTDEYEIMGLTQWHDVLLIFKPDSVFQLSGDNFKEYENIRLPIATGCVAPQTITTSDNSINYLGYDGTYSLSTQDKELRTVPFSDKIRPEFENLSEVEKDKIHTHYHKGFYYVCFPDKTLVHDLRLQAWTKWDTVFTSAIFDDEIDELVFGGKNGFSYIFKDGELKDEYKPAEYTAIAAKYRTPYMSFGVPEFKKRYKYVKVFYRPVTVKDSKITVKIEIDYVDQYKEFDTYYSNLEWGDGDWGDMYWGSMRQQMSKLIRFGGSGEFIQISFSNDKLGEDLALYGLVFGFKQKNKVR